MITQGPEAVAELLDIVEDKGAHRRDVERTGERLAHRYRPLEAVIVIFGHIEARGGVELDRAVGADRVGGQTALVDHLRIKMWRSCSRSGAGGGWKKGVLVCR